MSALLSIGEFSRVTHLSVKALRHYHDVGLLEPVEIDRASGYRFYATSQVPAAHVIRRLRDLDMPLDEVRAVLTASDVASRDRVIAAHLQRMEQQLAHTQATVASLRGLLAGTGAAIPVEYRTVDRVRSFAIGERVAWDDTEAWLDGAFDELRRALDSAGAARAGPDAALYSTGYFEAHVGEVVAYVATRDTRQPTSGRVQVVEIPAALLAVTVHTGPFDDLDETYGALGTFVIERAIGADGPVREHYLADDGTEVCWPISHVPS